MRKRLLAMLLCTCMVASFLPGLIVAEGESTSGTITPGWYTQPVAEEEYFLSESEYTGAAGEEVALYFLGFDPESVQSISVSVGSGYNDLNLEQVTQVGDFTFDTINFQNGYILVTGLILETEKNIFLRVHSLDGTTETFRIKLSQQAIWMQTGSYSNSKNIYTPRESYNQKLSVHYTNTYDVQFHYGVRDNYGDALTLKKEGGWSYTAPEGITGSSVTLEEKTDKNGVVFYRLHGEYFGDETCTGTLNLVLSDGTEASYSINFEKASSGWFTAPENKAANYLPDRVCYGRTGEEKTAYYFYTDESPLAKLEVIDWDNNVLAELDIDKASNYNGFTIDPTEANAKGYIAVTGTISSRTQIRLLLTMEDQGTHNNYCDFQVDPSLPVVWLRRGSYNSSKNTYTVKDDYRNSVDFNYKGSAVYQVHYGTQDAYGEPLKLKAWSYTAPEGIAGSSVTLEEKTDKNGMVFYQLHAEYMGDETCTGILNLELADGTKGSININFSKPSTGWYTAPEQNVENYLLESTYYGAAGEEKTLYYFHGRGTNDAWTKLEILDNNNNVMGEASLTSVTQYDGFTIDPTHYSDGYITVTGKVSSDKVQLWMQAIQANGRSSKMYCSFRVDPTLPHLLIQRGNSWRNEFTPFTSSPIKSINRNYKNITYCQFHYGFENNLGEPLALESWSYTAPNGVAGTSATISEKIDKNGVVFYEIQTRYLGAEDCTGTFLLNFSGDISCEVSVHFGKPDSGVYSQPVEEGRYYLGDSSIYGMPGEVVSAYYFIPDERSITSLTAVRTKRDGTEEEVEIPLNKITEHRLWTIDATHINDGYVAVTSTITEERTLRDTLDLRIGMDNDRIHKTRWSFLSEITDNIDASDSVPSFQEGDSTFTFGMGEINQHYVNFHRAGNMNYSWKQPKGEYWGWVWSIAAQERVGGSEWIASKSRFDQYITDVTWEIDHNEAGELMFDNMTSQDPEAFKVEIEKDETAEHPWSVRVLIKKEHLISARVKVTIKVKMPGWDEERAYDCWLTFAGGKNPTDRANFVFDAKDYDTVEELNELLALDTVEFFDAFREACFEEYSAYLAAEPAGSRDMRKIILQLPAVKYDDVIELRYAKTGNMYFEIQGTEKDGVKTTMPALVLESVELPTVHWSDELTVGNIDFIAEDGVTVMRGNEEISCGVLALDVGVTLHDSAISGHDIGVYAVQLHANRCRFDNNGIGYLMSYDELDTGKWHDGSGYFHTWLNNNEFVKNGIAVKSEKIPTGTTAIKMKIDGNNFIDNTLDMDMANGELGALFYAYKNYFGWTVGGTLVPRTALVELGKATTVVTNPRRWAPVGSGDNRLFIDILYPGVTWIINSQTSDLKISEDLISTEEDTELTVTDEEGKKVGKWKFEGGKKNK